MKLSIPKIMILANPARGYDRALLEGMARYAHENGPVQFFRPPPFWVHWEHFAMVDFIRDSKVDGIIMIEREELNQLLALKLPVVVSPYTRRRIPGAVNLVTDHVAIGRMAADYLIRSGFPHCAFCGYTDMFWSADRLTGFTKRLAEAGIVPEVYPGQGISPEDERDQLLDWLNDLPRPTGVMACTDERGRELIELCVSSGLRVPDEIGMIGVDNDQLLCDMAPVPLTSISNTAEHCGFEAVRRIVEQIRAGKTQLKPDIVVQPTYGVGRLSTDLIHTDDPALAKAIRFIREQIRRSIHVEDVARAAGLSRRVLEKRFKKHLGITVYAEIRRTKVDFFARMLLESNRTVAEIGEQLGFNDSVHIYRYFKKQTGLTPREYRMKYGRG